MELVRDITFTFKHCYAPTSKKLKGQIGLGLFVCLSIYSIPPTPANPLQRKRVKSKSDSIKEIISRNETEASVSEIVDSNSDLENVSEKVVAKKSKKRKN